MRLQRFGVWTGLLNAAPAAAARETVRELERLGYPALWIPESGGGKEVMAHAALLLEASERLVVATGIASIWARDATAAATGAATLAEASGGRFVLGLGVSHAVRVAARGHRYAGPLSAMRGYLDDMDRVEYAFPVPDPPPRTLGALRPKMLALARDRCEGANPYLVTVEHTVRARDVLGDSPVLAPEQAVLLESDPARAREVARRHVAHYLSLPNYVGNLRSLGWDDRDFADRGSDELVDALVAWGDPEAVVERVRAHHAAGADHVALQPLADSLEDAVAQLGMLAPALRAAG